MSDSELEPDRLGIDLALLGKIENEALKAKIAGATAMAATLATADYRRDMMEDDGDRLERKAIAEEGSIDEDT